MGHHTNNPGDTDPGHRIGQNCPAGSFVANGNTNNGGSVSPSTPSPSQTPPPTVNPPPTTTGVSSTITYINGYPTINGNYIDCNGNIDNDLAHHVANPGDTDPGHRIGQNCPAGSFVTANQNSSQDQTPTASGVSTSITSQLTILQPANNGTVNGIVEIRAVIPGLDINSYVIGWRTNPNAPLVDMPTDPSNSFKLNWIDFTNWTWNPNNIYPLEFQAKDLSGNVIGDTVINVIH
jgi:hypothetical protein